MTRAVRLIMMLGWIIGYEVVFVVVMSFWLSGVLGLTPLLIILTAPIGLLAMFSFLAFPIVGDHYTVLLSAIFIIAAAVNGGVVAYVGIWKRRWSGGRLNGRD